MNPFTKSFIWNLFMCGGLALVAFFTNSDAVSIIACVTGLLSVAYAAKASIWNYVYGFINIILFGYMFIGVQLYSDAALQVVFFFLSIYGCFIWLTKRLGNKVRPTTRMSRLEWFVIVLILPFGTYAFVPLVTVLWSFLLQTTVKPSLPYLDAGIAVLSMIAQYLLSRKRYETWYFWIAVDMLSIGMYLYKGLPQVAFTYFVFLILCITGAIRWRRELYPRSMYINKEVVK